MTTYYISPSGSDSNNGLGPDASHASNKPWLTFGKAMNTGSAVVPGDVVYIAPGYYYSGSVTPISGITSVGSPTSFIGDPTNAQGFKDGSGVRLAAGIPWWTTRTSGEGIDAALTTNAGSNLISAHTNKPSGLTFRNLALECAYNNSSGAIIQVDQAAGTNITFEDCYIIGYLVFKFGGGTAPNPVNHTIRRCVMFNTTGILYYVTTAAAVGADTDLGILIEENLIFGWVAQGLALGSNGGNIAGGIRVYNNTIYGAGLSTTALRVSTVTPIQFGGNLLICFSGQTPLSSGTTGQIIDAGYNRMFVSTTGNTNVTTGTGTVFATALNLVLPNLVKWGLELPRSDFFCWTDAAADTQKFSASGYVTADFRGRTIRPWGAGASIGCWQVPNLVQDTTSAITGGGTNSLKLTGAGETSLYIPVDATGFTVSIMTKSTSYGGTNYPQMCVCANPSIGVTSDTIVTASSASEQTITTATITPTAKGIMELRLISRSTSTTSSTYFDLLTSP